MTHDQASEERHEQAFARALCVPNNADLSVTVWPRCCYGLSERLAAAVELVIAGDDLERAFAFVAENREVADQLQQHLAGEYAADQRFELVGPLRREIVRGIGH